jgi:hypothetical protein
MTRIRPKKFTSLREQIKAKKEFTEDQKKRYSACFTQDELQQSPLDVFRWFLAECVPPDLKLVPNGCPPLMPVGRRSHLNHLAVQPASYRLRFQTIIPKQSNEGFANMTLMCMAFFFSVMG